MMTMKTLESWAISAYADNELEASERAEVERLIAQSPEAQAELNAIRLQKQALQKAFGGAAAEDVPHAMLRAVQRGPVPQPRRAVPAWAAIAAAVALLVVGAGGWFAGDRFGASSAQPTLAETALGAHQVYAVEVRHPVEVAGDDKAHLQQWLSKRVGVSFQVPDLTDEGYSLLGGRLLAEGDRPAALLMYEDAAKQRLTVYLAANPAKNAIALDMRQAGQLVVCTWEEPDMVYAFVGTASEEAMKKLAEAAHDRFES